MRHISGELVDTAKFHHPASIIVSGSSGVGKTTFCLNLVKNQHFTKKIKNVFYYGCIGGQTEKMDWHHELPDVAVHYSGKKNYYF